MWKKAIRKSLYFSFQTSQISIQTQFIKQSTKTLSMGYVHVMVYIISYYSARFFTECTDDTAGYNVELNKIGEFFDDGLNWP